MHPWPWVATTSTRIEDHDRDLAIPRKDLEEVIPRIEREDLLPEPIVLLVGGDAGPDLANLRADLNRRVGVRPEIVEPGRMGGLTSLRGHHGNPVTLLVVHHGRRAPNAALRPGVVEQEDSGRRHPGQMAAEPATREPVDGDVDTRRAPPQIQAALVRLLCAPDREPCPQ